jgi:hypothetical protein
MMFTLTPQRGLPGPPETTIQVAGHVLTVDGIADDLSQPRITAAALAASVDPTTTLRGKTTDGSFVTRDAAAADAMAQAVRAHVAHVCRQASTARPSGATQSTRRQTPDIARGWPGGAAAPAVRPAA